MTPVIVSGQAIGSCITVTDSTALAALSPSGIQVGTAVYNKGVGANFALTVSSAALVTDQIVAVSGITGLRWIKASGGGVASVVAGTGISVDATDPANPIVANTKIADPGTLYDSGASALQNWTFVTGLNGDTDGNYEIVGTIPVGALGSSFQLSFFSNTAPANAQSNNLRANGATVTGIGPSAAIGIGADPIAAAAGTLTFKLYLESKAGTVRFWYGQSIFIDTAGSPNRVAYTLQGQIDSANAQQINDLRILCDTAGGIGAHSKIILRKLGQTTF